MRKKNTEVWIDSDGIVYFNYDDYKKVGKIDNHSIGHCIKYNAYAQMKNEAKKLLAVLDNYGKQKEGGDAARMAVRAFERFIKDE